MPLVRTVSWHGPMVKRRANVPEQEWWDFPHHLSKLLGLLVAVIVPT
jgi:hypothetical protein